MSEVKDIFFELLSPRIEALGFVYKKSKGSFIKTENDLNFTIGFRWDGRGGTSIINEHHYYVTDDLIEKAYKNSREQVVFLGINMSASAIMMHITNR